MGKEWSLVIANESFSVDTISNHDQLAKTTEGLRSKEYQKAKNIAQKQKSNAGVTHNATNKFLFIL